MKRALVGACTAWLVVGVFAVDAGAHAAYKSSDPANKSTVSSPPSSIWAEFTEPPTQDSHMEVYDPCGARVDPGDSSVSGYRISVSNNGAAAGTYTVHFEVVSQLDGHGTTGNFTFTSSQGEPCPGSQPPPDDNGGGNEPKDPGPEPKPGDDGTSKDSSGSAGAAPGGGNSDDGGGKNNGGRGNDKQTRDEGNKGEAKQDRFDPNPTAQRRRPKPDAEEGMPLDGLLIALGVAALLGGAGGLVYAGIMGPRA